MNGLRSALRELQDILSEEYGVGLFAAPPIAVLWAADRIEDTDRAIEALSAANDWLERHGRPLAYPEYGHRLFGNLQRN